MARQVAALALVALSASSVASTCIEPAKFSATNVWANDGMCSHFDKSQVFTWLGSKEMKACNNADTPALKSAVANGLFGLGGATRDCGATCIFTTDDYFRWSTSGKCWRKKSGSNCLGSTAQETSAALAAAATLCATDLGCKTIEEDLGSVNMDDMCPPLAGGASSSGNINRGPDAVACGNSIKATWDIRLALANGMFGLKTEPRDCSDLCLFSMTTLNSYQWDNAQSCWDKHNSYNCPGYNKQHKGTVRKYKKSFCSIPNPPQVAKVPSDDVDPELPAVSPVPAPIQSPTIAVVTDEKTSFRVDNNLPCIPVRTELTAHGQDQLCSHNKPCTDVSSCKSTSKTEHGPVVVGCDKEYDNDVRLALANGMFGGGSGYSRDCAAWCLFDLRSDDVHYGWKHNAQCWERREGTECGAPTEFAYAVARKTDFCEMPAFPETPGDTGDDEGCVQVRTEHSSDLIDGLCSHVFACRDEQNCESNSGAQLGPEAVACDPQDNNDLHSSLANGLFGGASGTDRNCNSWCVYDYITPWSKSYRWESGCWKKKQGSVATINCGSVTEKSYAVDRQGRLCPPTQAPTATPTFTMPPTKEPTVAPSDTPTHSPSVSPSTSEPTSAPSKSPTNFPTVSQPTVAPTVAPSDSPTVSSPTTAPSVSPSVSPTVSSPTVSPTKEPTVSPSDSPTVSPSLSPSTSPPTKAPTDAPSMSPTISPTKAPTVYCLQYNWTNTQAIQEEFCPAIACTTDATGLHCVSPSGIDRGSGATACDSRFQGDVQAALANGMFGGSDGPDRDCDHECIWHSLEPRKKSYKWTGKCWDQKGTRNCGGATTDMKNFPSERFDLTCLEKAPIQQIPNPDDISA